MTRKRVVSILIIGAASGASAMALILAGGAGAGDVEVASETQATDTDVLQVVDEAGHLVLCSDGKPLEITEHELSAPPPPPPSAAQAEAAAARGNIIVLTREATCGPNGTVNWIETWGEEPASDVDPAPPRVLPEVPASG